jgi:ABC-type sugar transport system ATPase subunit
VALCDRVLVMFRGEIIKTIVGDAINKQEIVKASMGD